MTIFELDAQKADEKLERRMIASILKDAKPSTPYPIPVYDPIGEQERKTQQAEARQKEKERQDSLAESRKKAEQERMAREEQKRQLLAKEKAAQERLRQESQTREKEMMEKHMRLKAEQAALKSNLVNKEVEAAAASARQYVMSQVRLFDSSSHFLIPYYRLPRAKATRETIATRPLVCPSSSVFNKRKREKRLGGSWTTLTSRRKLKNS